MTCEQSVAGILHQKLPIAPHHICTLQHGVKSEASSRATAGSNCRCQCGSVLRSSAATAAAVRRILSCRSGCISASAGAGLSRQCEIELRPACDSSGSKSWPYSGAYLHVKEQTDRCPCCGTSLFPQHHLSGHLCAFSGHL